MECEKCDVHILRLNDEEMHLMRDAMSFFHECTINSQEFKNDDEATVMTAIKLESMCQTMGVPGFECS